MKILLLILLVSNPLWAISLSESEKNPTSEDILMKRPEHYLRDESMIYNFNSKYGIRDSRKYTGIDSNKLAFAGHISSDYEHFNNLLGFDVSYMRRFKTYDKVWWGAQFFAHNTKFDAITSNHSPRAGAAQGTEAATQRPGGVDNSIQAIGFGLGYRFKLLMDFWKTDDVFETIDVYANYLMLKEEYINKTYSGIGMTANYGIHKRVGTSFYYGGKISYNIGSVERSAINKEKVKDRSLSLGWMSLGFEVGAFY